MDLLNTRGASIFHKYIKNRSTAHKFTKAERKHVWCCPVSVFLSTAFQAFCELLSRAFEVHSPRYSLSLGLVSLSIYFSLVKQYTLKSTLYSLFLLFLPRIDNFLIELSRQSDKSCFTLVHHLLHDLEHTSRVDLSASCSISSAQTYFSLYILSLTSRTAYFNR